MCADICNMIQDGGEYGCTVGPYTNTTWLEETNGTILSRGTDNESMI